jgi:hypothetical protein
MKATVLFIFAIVLLSFPLTANAQGSGCSSGKRVDGIYYTDCYADTGDDTSRLQTAITAAAGHKLIFNEASYSTTSALTVPSHSMLEGVGPAKATDGATKSLIVLNSSGASAASLKSIFFIGEGEREITIRDLGLESGSGQTNTAGITASDEGTHHSTGGVYIDDIWFKSFTKGVDINPSGYDLWQFDSAKVSNSSFEECGTAIYVEAIGGLEIDNISIYSPSSGQNGVWVEVGGYIMMNYVVGNAPGTSQDRAANEFIHIGSHGVTSIRNSSSEFYHKELMVNDGGSEKVNAPLYLIANGFEGCPYDGDGRQEQTIEIHNAVVVSSGNEYTCNLLDESKNPTADLQTGPTRPQILGSSDVQSIGDRFCKWGSIWCQPQGGYAGSEFAVEGGTATLSTMNMNNYQGSDDPLLDLHTGFSGKTLFRLGNSYDTGGGVLFRYYHSFSVATDGWLEVEGNLDPPYSGYRFKKGPVQLAGVAQTDLSSFNGTSAAGSMLYCSNCTAGTNPCSTAGGGGGALAVKIGSGNWACK